LINNDCARGLVQVSRIASTRRQQITARFSGAQQGLSTFFASSMAGIQNFFASKQGEITLAVTRTLDWVRTAITGALRTAQALATQIRARIDRMIQDIAASVQSRVEGIAGRITGVIDSIPLPDIPGIGAIRAAALSLLNRAAGVVTGALGHLLGFIRTVFDSGMNALDSLLGGVASAVDWALGFITSAVQNVLQSIAQALNRIVGLIGSLLQGALRSVIVPMLNGIQNLIIRSIDSAEQRALGLLRANRNQYLTGLADAVTPVPGAAAASAKATSAESGFAAIQQLGRDAIQNSARIVQVLELAIGGSIASVVSILASVAARIVTAVAAALGQARQAIVTAVAQAVQLLARLAEAIGNFVRELIQGMMAALEDLVHSIQSAVQGNVDRLLEFARAGLSRISSFMLGFVRNLIPGLTPSANPTGLVGHFTPTPAFVPTPFLRGPPPKPIDIVIAIVIAILIAVVGFFGGTVTVTAVGLVIITIWGLTVTVTTTTLLIVAAVVVLFLLVVAWLIYRWLTKPKPKPKPPEPPCAITTRTLLAAPNGAPNTRKIVGVKEKVEMTSASPATWSARHGTVVPTTGTTVIWTAPPTGVVTLIKAILASGKTCLRLMTVKAPNNLTMVKASEHTIPRGTAGACMVTDVTIHPRTVCLGATQWLEVPGPATNVDGYFKKFSRDTLFHNPNPDYVPFNDDNAGPTDHAAWHEVPGPFSPGQFEWDIPNKYKVDGESDASGRPFTRTLQLFTMDATGTMTISKAGESVSRSP
jgi:hypothetical protein